MFPSKTLLFVIFCSSLFYCSAKISVPSFFQDGMILQQNSFVSIWGNATAGEAIEVLASWDSVETSTYADTKGKWLVQIPTPQAGGPFSIKIMGENELIIQDVLIGEVWIASGQSNMAWTLAKSEGGKEEARSARYPQIRFFTVERSVSSTPRINCNGSWEKTSPGKTENFSAVAYHFAKKLHLELGVPVGIIQTAWGGTPAEAWTPRSRLESQADFQPMMRSFDDALSRYREFPNQYKDPIHSKSPGILYNSMLYPLVPYTIKGVIWYQGEANTKDPWQYKKLFSLMVDSWRKSWGYRFSFYFVQIAPFKYKTPLSGTGIREAQYLSRKIARSGMVSILDLGNSLNIHPRKKKEVGERLALHALAKDYERKDLVFEGPVYKQSKSNLDELRLDFSSAKGGLVLLEGSKGFEVAGSDKLFYPATVRVDGATLYVKSEQVSLPEACRYAWSDTAVASLFNQAGLPASSFRTDNWPVFFSELEIRPAYNRSFDQFEVNIHYKGSENHEIHYTINGAEPSMNSPLFEKPFLLRPPAEIKAKVGLEEVSSSKTSSCKVFNNKALHADINMQTHADPPYKGQGGRGLINGVKARPFFQDKEWMGFLDDEVDFLLDFKEKKEFEKLGLNFLSQASRNIYPPVRIELYHSSNGKKFKLLQEINLVVESKKQGSAAEIIEKEIDLSGKRFRYLKIIYRNRKSLLSTQNSNRDSWIFIDEIMVE